MIKINKSINDLDTLAKKFYISIEDEIKVSILLDKHFQNPLNQCEFDFYDAIQNNLQEIIEGRPDVLQNLIVVIDPFYQAVLQLRYSQHAAYPNLEKKDKKAIKKNFNIEILKFFDYGRFVEKLAYKHAKDLDVKVCLYCNMSYTFTIQTNRGKARPEFDHFFNKARYPYFALSFYNLVPSCSTCNRSFKGEKPFTIKSHIHPFIEGFDTSTVFATGVNQVDYLLGKSGFNIQLNFLTADKKSARAKNNCGVFHILESHRFHEAYAGEMIKKAYLYNKSKIKELYSEFKIENSDQHIFGSEEEIIEMIFGNHIGDDKLHGRVLSKFTRDILEELKVSIPSP